MKETLFLQLTPHLGVRPEIIAAYDFEEDSDDFENCKLHVYVNHSEEYFTIRGAEARAALSLLESLKRAIPNTTVNNVVHEPVKLASKE